MAQGLDSTKTPARPSHEALDTHASASDAAKSEQERMDNAAMRAAKRGENRMVSNEETNRTNSMFTK